VNGYGSTHAAPRSGASARTPQSRAALSPCRRGEDTSELQRTEVASRAASRRLSCPPVGCPDLRLEVADRFRIRGTSRGASRGGPPAGGGSPSDPYPLTAMPTRTTTTPDRSAANGAAQGGCPRRDLTASRGEAAANFRRKLAARRTLLSRTKAGSRPASTSAIGASIQPQPAPHGPRRSHPHRVRHHLDRQPTESR
jgi:hypothetical protein